MNKARKTKGGTAEAALKRRLVDACRILAMAGQGDDVWGHARFSGGDGASGGGKFPHFLYQTEWNPLATRHQTAEPNGAFAAPERPPTLAGRLHRHAAWQALSPRLAEPASEDHEVQQSAG